VSALRESALTAPTFHLVERCEVGETDRAELRNYTQAIKMSDRSLATRRETSRTRRHSAYS
jgi:hypothetical protein